MTSTRPVDLERRLIPGVRVLLVCFTGLTLLATNQLYVLAERTADGFAWTINPPLTAAFFGGGYAAGCVLVVLSLRRGSWACARAGYLTVLAFTLLVLVTTLLHLDRFHFDASGALPRAAAWIWLIVYVVVPLAMLALLPRQLRSPGIDRRSGVRLGRGLRVALGVQGFVLIGVGAELFVRDSARALWPWPLTELTARAIASWLIALGIGTLLALVQDDLSWLQPAAVTYTVLGVLQLVALLRFTDTVDWTSPSLGVYLAAVLSMFVVGLAGLVRARHAPVTTGLTRERGARDSSHP